MALYRIHFTWKEKEVSLRARELDMTHPYFVSVGDFVFPKAGSLIIDPSEDSLRRAFGTAKHVMIPFQSVSLIEELHENDQQQDPGSRIKPFQLVDQDSDEDEDDGDAPDDPS
ncbi:MAG: DUF1820 family protein [Spirochaetaceae bacterium]|nr:MAG: DUF1820 family protein [Spirochaetaceae bacterium]